MDNPILYRILKILGVIHSKFDQISFRYTKSSRLLLYSIFFTISLQVFNICSFYYREIYVNDVLNFNSISHLIIMKTLMSLDCACWITINTSIIFRLIVQWTSVCKLLNNYLKISFYTRIIKKDQINFVHKLFGCVTITGIPIIVFVNYGCTNIAYFTIFSYYLMASQFLAGHLYEFTLFERLNKRHKLLQNKLQMEVSEKSIKVCITYHLHYEKIAKQLTKVFELNQFVELTAVLILCSMYSLYGFEWINAGVFKPYD